MLEPWEHGTSVRCTAHPGFWDYNSLRLEGPDPGASADELAAAAERFQEGLRHRRIEVEDEAAGARLRPAFEQLGWKTTRLVWLALSEPPGGPDFEEVPIEVTRDLRLEWARSEALEISEQRVPAAGGRRGGRRAPARPARAGGPRRRRACPSAT